MEMHPIFILVELIENICIIKAIYRINAVLTKISMFFTRTLKKTNPEVHKEAQKASNSQTMLIREIPNYTKDTVTKSL